MLSRGLDRKVVDRGNVEQGGCDQFHILPGIIIMSTIIDLMERHGLHEAEYYIKTQDNNLVLPMFK